MLTKLITMSHVRLVAVSLVGLMLLASCGGGGGDGSRADLAYVSNVVADLVAELEALPEDDWEDAIEALFAVEQELPNLSGEEIRELAVFLEQDIDVVVDLAVDLAADLEAFPEGDWEDEVEVLLAQDLSNLSEGEIREEVRKLINPVLQQLDSTVVAGHEGQPSEGQPSKLPELARFVLANAGFALSAGSLGAVLLAAPSVPLFIAGVVVVIAVSRR